MTPKELTARENAIFDSLEYSPTDKTFLGKLYRDGVPTPDSFLKQRVRVLFVFREPNLSGVARDHDMRDEVRDKWFRSDSLCQAGSPRGWWNNKAGMFAHAVATALDGEPAAKSFRDFTDAVDNDEWHHEVVNRFAYIQIKKTGGGGSSDVRKIREHARKYAATLKAQIDLYQPDMIVGCGVGAASPVRLLNSYVVSGGTETTTPQSGATWWEYQRSEKPLAMLQQYHPARRGSKMKLYLDVWTSVREVAQKVNLVGRQSAHKLSRG